MRGLGTWLRGVDLVLMCGENWCVNVCSTVSQGHCVQLQRLGGHEGPKGRPCLLLIGKPAALL